MVIDKRKHHREIKIEIEAESYNFNLDSYIDALLEDMEVFLTQRKLAKDMKITITIQ